MFHVAMTTITSSTFRSYQGFERTRFDTSKIFDNCLLKCLAKTTCKTVTIGNGKCYMYSRSPFDYRFSKVIPWIYYSRTGLWSPMAKFSTSSGVFNGDDSYTLWNNPDNSVNTDSCASQSESSSCNRHFVHNDKDEISKLVTKIKLSFYEAGVEAAWVIFDKQPGSDDNWFQASRVLDSYPWNTELLRNSSEMNFGPQPLDSTKFLSIFNKDDSFTLNSRSPHRYWMKLIENTEMSNGPYVCAQGTNVPVPYIVFSKVQNSILLSKSSVAHIFSSMNWTEAEHFCETYLKVPIANFDEVDIARTSDRYQCCTAGWMGGARYARPMANYATGCGGPGMMGQGNNVDEQSTLYCKTNTAIVGVADTMVISVNV